MKRIITLAIVVIIATGCHKKKNEACYTCKIERKSYKQTTSPKVKDIVISEQSVSKCGESKESILLFENVNTKVETRPDSIVEYKTTCTKN